MVAESCESRSWPVEGPACAEGSMVMIRGGGRTRGALSEPRAVGDGSFLRRGRAMLQMQTLAKAWLRQEQSAQE